MVKRTLIIFTLLLIILGTVGCSSTDSVAGGDGDTLVITDGTIEKTYTVPDLEVLPEAMVSFQEVNYLGVPLVQLLADAGYDPQDLRAVRAVAADGFSASYEPTLFNQPDTVVAYRRTDGPLVEDEGTFRMVLPGQEGKLNVRFLNRIEVIP